MRFHEGGDGAAALDNAKNKPKRRRYAARCSRKREAEIAERPLMQARRSTYAISALYAGIYMQIRGIMKVSVETLTR